MFRKRRPYSPVQLSSAYHLRYVPLIMHKKCTISLWSENRFKKLFKKKKKRNWIFFTFTFTGTEFEGLDEIVKERVGFGHGALRIKNEPMKHRQRKIFERNSERCEFGSWKRWKCLAMERSFSRMNEGKSFPHCELIIYSGGVLFCSCWPIIDFLTISICYVFSIFIIILKNLWFVLAVHTIFCMEKKSLFKL